MAGLFPESLTPARSYFPGMGQAVADRTVNRKIQKPYTAEAVVTFKIPRDDTSSLDSQVAAYAKSKGYGLADYFVDQGDGETLSGWFIPPYTIQTEEWADVAYRVAMGNAFLDPRLKPPGMHPVDAMFDEGTNKVVVEEFGRMHHHLRQASLLMSGRHLQHGDPTQPTRNMEVFTNCLGPYSQLLTLEFGPAKIGEIMGETVHVLASDGEWRPAIVKSYGTQRLNRIEFGTNGRFRHEVEATTNHRWLLSDGTETDALKVGDKLQAAKSNVDATAAPEAVLHGLIFGDGTAHKTRTDTHRVGVSYGRTYASIRVCKQDKVQEEIHAIFDKAGYRYTTPPHAKNDRVYYLGKFPYGKELPCTTDADYIEGFIRGWWMADGYKRYDYSDAVVISTSDESAVEWLKSHAAYAGYSIVSLRKQERKEGDGSYANGKPLYTVRLRKGVQWVVKSITPLNEETVYCVEEPITKSFTLANGLLTGNCSTSATTFLLFYLLLNGSGVGRDYSDAMIRADLNQMPIVVPVIDWSHDDVGNGLISGYLTERDAHHLYAGRTITTFKVPDSREGWAKAVEIIERFAFEGRREEVLILDFSGVRPNGAPIQGMQGRPASGPGPLMGAIKSIAQVRDAGMAPWRAALYADHYAAECVLVGGARRAARMATKFWKDRTVLDFISVKRGGFLWSSNNSVTIDREFREAVKRLHPLLAGYADGEELETRLKVLLVTRNISDDEAHAYRVLRAAAYAAYHDGTGEPGFINQDKLTNKPDGLDAYLDGLVAESAKFKLAPETLPLMKALVNACAELGWPMITNPCGEICLLMLGAYCVIADVVPFHAQNDDDAEDAFRTAVRALIRTNTMDSLYSREVKRTNRIGVGMTGFHEWAYSRFGFTWHDLVDEEKSKALWLTVSRFKRAVVDEARRFSELLGVVVPHTDTTFKPAGTTSKLFGLTEGAHLPSMREFLRWVQFRNDDPLVKVYEEKGYPVRRLKSYSGTTIVGFPTKPAICELGDGQWVVTAAEATPEEQYRFLQLLEKYWLTGVEEDGATPLEESGNQISYTLKYSPSKVNYDQFLEALIGGQFSIRACSVMPQTDTTAYEYVPEQSLSKLEYEKIASQLQTGNDSVKEDIGAEHMDCGTGGCPIDVRSDEEMKAA